MLKELQTSSDETPGGEVLAPADGRTLTEQQVAFVLHFTSTPDAIGNASESARRAGYSQRSAAELGHQLLEKPHVQDAIREANKRQISGKIAAKSIALLSRVIDDEAVSMKVRVDAARTILDRAGYGAFMTQPKRSDERAMNEMTKDELLDLMRQARKEMDRARVINAEPSAAEATGTAVTTLEGTER